MAIQWGPRTASINGQFFQLGVDVSISGTTVSVAYYFWADAPIAQQGLILTKTGQLSGTQSFAAWSAGQVSIGSWSFTGVRGQTYTVGGRVTGTYNGLSPSVSTTVQIPSLVPGKMAKPVISSITKDSARITGKAPSSGSAITRYNLMLALDAAGTRVFRDTTGTSPVFDAGNLPSNQTFWVWMRAENSAGWGDWSDSAVFTTVASGPAAPIGVHVEMVGEMVGGESYYLRWVPQPSANAPYVSQKVQRRTDLGEWVTVSNSVSGTQTSYWVGVSPNHRYEFRVVAVNSGGETPSLQSTTWQTKPASPGDLTAGRDGQGNISLTWIDRCPDPMLVDFRIEHSTDGQVWEHLATTAMKSFLLLSPSIAVPHHYRVRSEVYQSVSAQTDVLSSGLVLSAPLYLPTPPLAPTPVSPEGVTDADRGITLQWRHNPVDTSPQSAFALRHRLQGTEAWATVPKTTSAESFKAITGYVNGQAVEWQAQTWGEHADPSPWSNSVFVLSETPIVTISTPSTTHNLSTLTLAWSYFQAASSIQAQWQAELLNASGVLVETRSGSAGNTRKFSTVLQNESLWKVRLRARSAAGLWSDWEEREFQVSYSRPAAPIISTRFLEDSGAVEIEIKNPLITRFSWEGEPHNSASIKRFGVPEVARNRFINPDFEGPYLPTGAEFTTKWSGSGTRALRIPGDHTSAGYGLSPYGLSPYGM